MPDSSAGKPPDALSAVNQGQFPPRLEQEQCRGQSLTHGSTVGHRARSGRARLGSACAALFVVAIRCTTPYEGPGPPPPTPFPTNTGTYCRSRCARVWDFWTRTAFRAAWMSGLVRADSWWAAQRYAGDRSAGGFVSDRLTCARVGCGRPLPTQRHQGNPRKWCSESCRVAAYRAVHGRRQPRAGA